MNIVLIGFMGAGKTVVGKRLAGLLKTRFIDVDELIEQKEKKRISDIFKEKGEEYFRRCESEMIAYVALKDNCIISPGGGAILRRENLVQLQKKGVLIYLIASPHLIYQRIKGDRSRPLLQVNRPQERIKKLLAQREPYYRQADIYIDTSNLDVQETAQRILEEIVRFKGRGRNGRR